MDLWADIYRPGRDEDRQSDNSFDQIAPIPGQTSRRLGGGSSYDDYLNDIAEKDKSAIPDTKSITNKVPPKTMTDRYIEREKKLDPDTMQDRYTDPDREIREAPETMMERLQRRDRERKRIARAEQAKLEESKKDYNKNRERAEPPEDLNDDPNKVDRAARKGADLAVQELENEHSLSTLKIEKEQSEADLSDHETRIAALEAAVFSP